MDPHNTPAAYFRAAREFYVAASHLLNQPRDTPLPALFLIARSVELSTKSVLLGAGIPASKLAYKPFRHNLTNLLKEAVNLKLVDSSLSPEHHAAINLLSNEYDSSGLGYIEEGRTYLLPRLDLVEEAAAYLLKSADNSCI